MQAYESLADRWRFLTPWTALLRAHELRVVSKYATDFSYRCEFDAIELAFEQDATNAADGQLAEALELVATALALHPEAWSTILIDQCGCVGYFNPSGDSLSLRIQLHWRPSLDGDKWSLFHTMLGSRECSAGFYVAMRRIQQATHSVSSAPKDVEPVGIKLSVSLTDEVADLVELVHLVKPYSTQIRDPAHCDWSTIETVDVDWTVTDLTTRRVEMMMLLILRDEPRFVHVSRISIDPSEIKCPAQDFQRLYSALVRAFPTIEVDLDVQSDPCRSDRIVTALSVETIAATPSKLKQLHLGGMRDDLWGHLFLTLLHPQAACTIEHLAFDLLDEMAVDSFRSALMASLGYRTPHSISIDMNGADPALLCLLIEAFGGNVQYLNLVEHCQPIPSETVTFLMRSCPRLKYLDLNNVKLESMSIFYTEQGPSRCRLSMLALVNSTLQDPGSLATFFKHLADPRSFVGQYLNEFVVGRMGSPSNEWNKLVVDMADLRLVEQVLHNNSRVHTLQLDVQDETPERAVNAFASENGIMQRAPLAPQSKLALLSVTTHTSDAIPESARQLLSHDTIRLILEYAADRQSRWIKIGRSFLAGV